MYKRQVREGGTIGAILPEGAPRKMPSIAGIDVVYSEPKKNRFKDASVTVVFAKWVKCHATVLGQVPAHGQMPLFQAA